MAAKQLTASDLTLFASQYHKEGQRSKQKAINLNADVFVSKFYPGLRDRFAELHFGLTIVGPSGAPPYVISRKALRTEGAKNWRLNGEIISDPDSQAGRFDGLAEGDIAILAFEGTEQPQQVSLVLVSATADAALHNATSRVADFQGRASMRAINEGDLRSILEETRAEYQETHPLEFLLTADSVEDAIFGVPEAQEATVRSDGRGVAVSPESIRRQVTAAGETGQLGEEVFEQWLCSIGHRENDFQWVSRTHGRAAFDFELSRCVWEAGTGRIYVDVKSTRGSHDTAFHMSAAELRWAADHPGYRIARISSLTEQSGMVRILAGISELAADVLKAIVQSFPPGVLVDSVQILPSNLREVYSAKFDSPEDD